ncbi:MAG: cardiolipin synthase [Lentilactobacillus diolivorans]|jgi:cardiolipin synthase|uniref:Cardiolipin synthase n=2 Tax=Lentilactobacillus diolivorans TaxID=179838 RepID=A0A0R1S709_9LACO|nr:cardiolipin synthase [Lentilactobacillus diolivorans]KRL64781.1 cardiolipin synthetase [Lentilactobacillus diolivorans DSM 14421]MCH4164239.1 cardiolipin synthase [Lentilactobacillus diolivorans]RRG02007.1 MAG: cardiolipin synthase [Lactobacillus sp.]GEP24672.1 cardiolipin synthase [Lentilactobacillus diolivorans]
MNIDWSSIFNIIVVVNAIFAIITVFREKRDIAAIWAWLLVLVFLPVAGFIAYAFLGRKLPKNRLFKLHKHVQMQLDERLKEQRAQLGHSDKTPADEVVRRSRNAVDMFMTTDSAFLSRQNKVRILTNGNDLFHRVIEDIEAAQKSIHIEFYTFYNDRIGNEILDLLVKKAQQGVEVRVIYDSWGSMGTTRKFFQPLLDAGGRAFPFLNTRSVLLDFRINFRDHRKIIVIDGKIGYTGGFNIGDQYLGRKKKFGNWRDTHIRIIGSGVFGLQARFILDWNATSPRDQIDEDEVEAKYFPVTTTKGTVNMQIVSSGPDSDLQQIKMGYIKLITMATKYCWIQSPYLIPDDSVMDALRIAAMSGVDVRIMVPNMPDHPFVYRATQYYARQLSEQGVKIYYYNNGFIHAKTMVIDDEISSVGSANLDYRSFKLNFEINAFIYDQKFSQDMRQIFINDMTVSNLQTAEMFEKQSLWLKFKQTFSRLLSPIL